MIETEKGVGDVIWLEVEVYQLKEEMSDHQGSRDQ